MDSLIERGISPRACRYRISIVNREVMGKPFGFVMVRDMESTVAEGRNLKIPKNVFV
jgi:hypothetical protein